MFDFEEERWQLWVVLPDMKYGRMVDVRPATERDVPGIAEVYNYFVRETTFSYMEKEFSHADMLEKYHKASSRFPFIIAESEDGRVIGFTYADSFRTQSAWKLVESTIYLMPGYEGGGTGRAMYELLLAELRENPDVVGVVAMISLENEASIRFHESMGFELVGKWEHCAFKFKQWLGTGCWMHRLK